MLGIWTFMLWCFGVSQESHHLVGGELLGRTPKTPLNTLIGTGAPLGTGALGPLGCVVPGGRGPSPLVEFRPVGV